MAARNTRKVIPRPATRANGSLSTSLIEIRAELRRARAKLSSLQSGALLANERINSMNDTTIGVGQTTTIEVNGDTPFFWVLRDVEARLKSLSARRANSRRHLSPVFHLSYGKGGRTHAAR